MPNTGGAAPELPDTRRARARSPQTWVFLAGRAGTVEPHLDSVKDLLFGRHQVGFGFATGRPPRGLSKQVRRRRLSVAAAVPGALGRPLRQVLRPVPTGVQLRAALSHDPWLRQVLSEADQVLYLDAPAAALGARVRGMAPQARHWQPEQVEDVLAEEQHWRHLDHLFHLLAARAPHEKLPMGRIRSAVSWLQEHPTHRFGPPADLRPAAVELAHRLNRRGRTDEVMSVLAAASLMKEHFPPDLEGPSLRAVASYLSINSEEETPEDLAEQLTSVFSDADRALRDGDLAGAATRATIGLDLMFHQRLHTDVPRTPLVEEPAAFLAPLYDSQVGLLLTGTVPREDGGATPVERSLTARPPLRVSLLPGSYPWHARRLAEALAADDRADLTELPLQDAGLKKMGLSATFVGHRMARASAPQPDAAIGVTEEEGSALRASDVVVADWADKGAVWASTVLPSSARMVVRIHSVDVLSAGVHLVDWSRVDDVVLVGRHMEQIFLELLGERVSHLRTHVIPNIVPPTTAVTGAGAGAPAGTERTLAMVGWGQRVKDPGMALDILAGLRERDPAWRLRLIGGDFVRSNSERVERYVERFRRRLLEPDLLDAVEFVGQTRDVAGHLAGAGFILSTSLRESFHIGAMEGVAAGAYPVVREWPAYARYHGAASLFPQRCVFDTVEEAVDMVWALRDPADRAAATGQVQEEMRGVLSGSDAAERLLDVILG